MTKRILSMVLSLALLLSCVSGITLFTMAEEVSDPMEGTESSEYAQIDFNVADTTAVTGAKLTAVTSVTAIGGATIAQIPGSTDYGMKIISKDGHGIYNITLDTSVFGITEEDLENGTNLAVSVEYYVPSTLDGVTRFFFEYGGDSRLALYDNWNNECIECVCVNQSAPFTRDELNVATFIVGKDVTYRAPSGSIKPGTTITEAMDVETYTFAKTLVNGGAFQVRAWGSMSETNPVYIKSITIYDADELVALREIEDGEYVEFDYAASPYYPQYAKTVGSLAMTTKAADEYYAEDANSEYPKYNDGYVSVDSLQSLDGNAAQDCTLRIYAKDGSNMELNPISVQYQVAAEDDPATEGIDERYSESTTLAFTDGVAELEMKDTVFCNTLGDTGSIRLRVSYYVQSVDEEGNCTYTLQPNADLSDIARIEVIPAPDECAHEHTTIVGASEATYTEAGYTGDTFCNDCSKTIGKGTVIPKLSKYAQIDFNVADTNSAANAVLTAVTSVAPFGSSTIGQIPDNEDANEDGNDEANEEEYGLRVIGDATGVSFTLDTSVFGIDAEDLENGKKLAVSVEYYVPSDLNDNIRIFFASADGTEPRLALYSDWVNEGRDCLCVNQSAKLTRDALDVATFIVGKDVTYHAPNGRVTNTGDPISGPTDVDTLTFAQHLVNGDIMYLRVWGNMDETNALYIKSVTIYDADELADPEATVDGEYIDFEATSPYYPQYTGTISDALTMYIKEADEYWDGSKVYPKYNYGYMNVSSLRSKDQTTPVDYVLRIYAKEGSDIERITVQYQMAVSGDARWSAYYPLEFTDGVAEVNMPDGVFCNNLMSNMGSIRLRDDYYVLSEDGESYILQPNDDLTDIARIELFLMPECPHEKTTILNKKEPACKEAGYTGDKVCLDCGDTLENGTVIPTIPHDWDEGTETITATPDRRGEIVYRCGACGATTIEYIDFVPELGDVDGSGKIDSTDARLVLQFAVKKISGDALNLNVADVDGSGTIDSTDARLILQLAVGKIKEFPTVK